MVSFDRESKPSAGYSLGGFRIDEELELYYDVARDGRDVGYISRGWTDPGFRLGEVLVCRADTMHRFHVHRETVLNVCATHVVACGTTIDSEEVVLDLTIRVYEGGLNPKTFDAAFDHLLACTHRVKEVLFGYRTH